MAHSDSAKRYRKKNTQRLNKTNREYRQKLGETWRAKRRAYDAANREREIKRKREYYARNKKKIAAREKARRLRNRDKVNAYHRAYQKAHPEHSKSGCARRKARKLKSAIGSDREAYLRFVRAVRLAPSIRCYWCNEPVSRRKRQIDHIIPLSRGGPDSVENLCCACQHCNISKKDRLPEDFDGQFLLF